MTLPVELRRLSYAIAVAETQNFARAAQTLQLSTSTVSRGRCRSLGEELEPAPFEHGRAGVRLTSGGKAGISHVRRVRVELETIECA